MTRNQAEILKKNENIVKTTPTLIPPSITSKIAKKAI
jgi:hypothetical protein